MVKTYTATISLGLREGYEGKQHDISEVADACREYIEKYRLCISITPTTFCYPSGIEKGCFIQLIQYPRFIIPESELLQHAKNLTCLLKTTFNQNGVTIVTTDETLTYYNNEWVENIREG